MASDAERAGGLLEKAVARLVGGRETAVAFSGGLDSGLLAAIASRHAASLRLYTAGCDGSHDVRLARETAARLGSEWVHVPIAGDTLVDALGEVIRAAGTTDPLTLAFELPLHYVMSSCTEPFILTGQGADELFAGFARYRGMDAGTLSAAREADLMRLTESTLPCELRLAAYHGKELAHPYLDPDLVRTVLGLGAGAVLPAGSGTVKALLRQAAVAQGAPFLAGIDKKAAQYGSGAMAALKRICRAEGTDYPGLVARIAAAQGAA